jgi:uncharacterized protein
MGKLFVCLILTLSFLNFGPIVNGHCAAKKVEISARSLGAALHIFGTAWAKIVNKELKDEISVTVVSTAGSLENVRLLMNNKTDFGFVVTPQAREAFDGRDTFAKETPAKKLRTVFTYPYGGLQFVVKEDSKIKTMTELKGKKVTVGAPGSAGALYNSMVLEAHGLGPKDYKKEMLPYSAGVRSVNDGVIDCFAIFAPAPVGLVMEIASSHKIRILPFEKAAIDKFCKDNPGFIPGVFKKGSYKNLTNTEDIPTVVASMSVLSRDEVNEEIVYKMTKALWDNINEFQLCHATAKEVILNETLKGASVPLHPGALKFYKEKGLSISKDLIP